MRKHLALGATLILFLLLAASFLIFAASGSKTFVVRVRSRDTGQVIYQGEVFAGQVILLTYTHSVYGQQVKETYRISGNGQLVFSDAVFGNGLTQESQDAEVAFLMGGEVKIVNQERVINKLYLIVGETGKPIVTIGGVSLDLYKHLGQGARVELTVTRT